MILLPDVICKSSSPVARVGEDRMDITRRKICKQNVHTRRENCNANGIFLTRKTKIRNANRFSFQSYALSVIEMTREGLCSNPVDGIDRSKEKIRVALVYGGKKVKS
jgi:hypothetical protein